jgi:hypothetical protein
MFHNELFAQASVAFRKAGLDRQAKICDAYLSQKNAGFISTTSPARIQAFVTAAKAFIACAQKSPAMQVKESLTCYEAAGDCYSQARDPESAGDSYMLAKLYLKAACAYQEVKRFDKVVKVINEHGGAFTDDLREQFVTAARLHYFKVRFNGWLVSQNL